MGTITVIASGKGGVGKSTTTVGLGSALARGGKSVLLIDGDSGMRTLDLFTGVAESLVFDISDVISGSCEPIRAIYPCKGCENLYLLPASASYESRVKPELFNRLITGLSGYYDHIIIDSPAGIGEG
ncbi:MAG: AAA family ATPase, partial [Oscillospiraceae bacterium]|nr:AAA family ATPase [Oscillospiraceae bacterium]